MGRTWSVDAVAKHRSTSPFGTLVAFSESPLDENLLYTGSDDGLMHSSNDGGESWTKIDGIAGVPEMTYVNAVLASQHNRDRVYAAFNHHKYGDFKPYLFVSNDMGATWTKISGDLPERGSIYAIAEDHEDEELLFVGTEFGVFASNDAGETWKQIKTGVPTIAVRDLAIQERENDLVLGTFGRSFYVLDDYSPLRHCSEEMLNGEGGILPVRDALQYIESSPLGGVKQGYQGNQLYLGENLGPVALVRYYVKEVPTTLRSERKKREKEALEAEDDIPIPTYEGLVAENKEEKPYLEFIIRDSEGNIVRMISNLLKQVVQFFARYSLHCL
jgi:hypothetical protein